MAGPSPLQILILTVVFTGISTQSATPNCIGEIQLLTDMVSQLNQMKSDLDEKIFKINIQNYVISMTCGLRTNFSFAAPCPGIQEATRVTAESCKSIQMINPEAPSGYYKLITRDKKTIFEVYCEMEVNGGGYSFLQPQALSVLTDADVQNIFTDKRQFLLRFIKCDATQPYTVLSQLPTYTSVSLKLGLNQNTDYATPQNVAYLGQPYLYFGFLPRSIAANRTVQGIQTNQQNLTFQNCDSNPNSYIALFPYFKEKNPVQRSDHGYQWCKGLYLSAVNSQSSRLMRMDYFMFNEIHMGGCGCFSQTDQYQKMDCILGAAIGFR